MSRTTGKALHFYNICKSGGIKLDLIYDNPKHVYRSYLFPSIASALVTSVYAFVDTIAVGQYAGKSGAAAIAVVMPLFGLFTFLSILSGVGGCIWMAKSAGEQDADKRNQFFTASFLLLLLCASVTWIVLLLSGKEILCFFGADDALLKTVMDYARWIIFFAPAFFLPAALGAYLRNDGAPRLAMKAVIIGGSINIFGDWFFVFPLDLGVSGAGLATAAGTLTQTFLMGSYFLSGRSTLRLVRPKKFLLCSRQILSAGAGASVIEFATIFITILINNQIVRYGSMTNLAVYGVISTIAALFQSTFSGIGQAVQPIVSAGLGARKYGRILAIRNMALRTMLILGCFFLILGSAFPNQIMRIFISVDDAILASAPGIVRMYFPLFLFQGINVLAIYYLQSILDARRAGVLALLRSALLSGLFLLLLPVFFGMTGVWIAQPLAEALTAALAFFFLFHSPVDRSQA